jgi:hypothetical protein
MAANTPMLLRAGLVEGNTEAGVLAAGQVSGILEDLPTCQELIDRIVTDAVARIGTLAELAQDAESVWAGPNRPPTRVRHSLRR